MPRINCNIIKDLLPSYIDELCSTESKQLIEEHFKECENCKRLYEQTKLIMLHNEHMQDAKEIDYFKTIRINVNKKNRTLLIITVVLFLIQLYINSNPYLFGSSAITFNVNYIFPVLIASVMFAILPDFSKQTIPSKIKLSILGIELCAMTYIFGLLTFVAHALLNDTTPFGMQAEQVGPFLLIQIRALSIGFILIFVATLIISLRKKAICPALCFLPMGGMSLMFEYSHRLHEFSTRFTFTTFVRPYLIIICEMIILVGIYMFVNRKKHI